MQSFCVLPISNICFSDFKYSITYFYNQLEKIANILFYILVLTYILYLLITIPL
nr:MAG TPA: hypothetical protein [Caudoviricetes sp.]